VNKKLGCVLLSETRVTDTNQSTVVSEMGHSCVQTSRHWGGNQNFKEHTVVLMYKMG